MSCLWKVIGLSPYRGSTRGYSSFYSRVIWMATAVIVDHHAALSTCFLAGICCTRLGCQMIDANDVMFKMHDYLSSRPIGYYWLVPK